jgi:hypothetical protein
LNAAFVEFAAYIPSAFLKEPALRDAIYVNGKRQKSALDAEAKRELKRAKYAKAAAQEPPPSLPAPASTATEQLSRDELKAKLHAKIESLRTERKANKAQPVSREALIRKSQEQALAAQAEKKRLKKEAKAARKAAAQLAEPSTSKAVAKPPVAVQAPAVQDPAPPAEADLQFSSLDFTAQDTLQPFDTLPGGKAAKRNKAKKDPAAALEKIESRKAFLEKLTPQAQERAQDKDKWAALEARASGAKVLDDEVKLKKMVKRQEKQKQKSKKAWCVDARRGPSRLTSRGQGRPDGGSGEQAGAAPGQADGEHQHAQAAHLGQAQGHQGRAAPEQEEDEPRL